MEKIIQAFIDHLAPLVAQQIADNHAEVFGAMKIKNVKAEDVEGLEDMIKEAVDSAVDELEVEVEAPSASIHRR